MEINQKKIETLFKVGYNKLNDFQKEIFNECTERDSGGLSLPMGSGKTLIALTLALHNVKDTGLPILILCAKSLITSWEMEIKKFFGDKLKYEFIHKGNLKKKIDDWKIRDDIQLILTTPDNMRIFYTENDVQDKFINTENIQLNNAWYLRQRVLTYISPDKPFLNDLKGGGVFYSQEWGTIVVDEAQKYTNINTKNCRALCSLYSKKRWALSGTLFDEPVARKALGYFKLIDDPIGREYDNVPELNKYIRSYRFKGFNRTLVHRKTNPAFIPPKINNHTITHKLTKPEELIYTCMKKILIEIKKKADKLRAQDNNQQRNEALRKFNAYKLTLIIYMRQVLICALIPITSIAIDAFDYKENKELSKIVMDEINKLEIDDYLNDTESIKSSRILNILNAIDNHKDEKIVIFSGFKNPVDILEQYIPKDRKVFKMLSKMNTKQRGELIENFRNSENGVLLLTFQLGAEGLNLQFASTVILTDFWWNPAKTEQAIARIFRYGQKAKEINVYMFIANTGIEKIILEKQQAKKKILKELRTGPMISKIPKIKDVDDLIRLIEIEDNKKLLDDIYNKTSDLTKDFLPEEPEPKPKSGPDLEDSIDTIINSTIKEMNNKTHAAMKEIDNKMKKRYEQWAKRIRCPDRRRRFESGILLRVEGDAQYTQHQQSLFLEEDSTQAIIARMVWIRGLSIINIVPDSPAYVSGIQRHEYIVQINEHVIQNLFTMYNGHPLVYRQLGPREVNNIIIRFINNLIELNTGKPMVLRVFNILTSEFRDVSITPNNDWGYDKLLGLSYMVENKSVFLRGQELPECVSGIKETYFVK